MATIRVAAGATVNIGNYNSRRLEVELTRSCEDDDDSIEGAYENVRAWVNEKLAEAIQEVVDETTESHDSDF